MVGYLNTKNKNECFGCEACMQICSKQAIVMSEDVEGFRYPVIDKDKCINCGLCNKVCPYENPPIRQSDKKVAFGGYIKDINVRAESTSGGAFSAIVDMWCDNNYVIFGAKAVGLDVFHTYITDKTELYLFRKSKYSQSLIGSSFNDVKKFLEEGKKVLFSGTPCQIAGLKTFLQSVNQDNLLTIEVICEGVPTPNFIRKYNECILKTHKSHILELDYRYKNMKSFRSNCSGKWDFQVMRTSLQNGKNIKIDRWFNPFWSIWLNHLMSRPSCYKCPFATIERNADISLGDLWGVHLYCPELYGHNSGSSLIVCNSEKGINALKLAREKLYGHELDFFTALKYQSPMRKSIGHNPNRTAFMKDVVDLDYKSLCKKWAKKPTFKLLWSKYIWGNRQDVWLWNLKQKLRE